MINYDNNKDKENKKCKKIRTIQTNGSYLEGVDTLDPPLYSTEKREKT